jgi:ABC-type lipoprotein export system ATPase subunit
MSPKPAIARIHIKGVHGHQEIEANFRPGLNIVHGKNGTGKTTLLHIIANLFERDVERFCYLAFDSIDVKLHSGTEIKIRQTRSEESAEITLWVNGHQLDPVKRGVSTGSTMDLFLRDRLGASPVYLPAFRAILDAAATRSPYDTRHSGPMIERREREAVLEKEREAIRTGMLEEAYYAEREYVESVAQKTVLCREWFGRFVPVIRYPSLRDVAQALISELSQAATETSLTDRETLSTVFVQVLDAVLGGQLQEARTPDSSIADMLRGLYTKMSESEQQESALNKVYSAISSLVQNPPTTRDEVSSLAKSVIKIYDEAISARNQALRAIFRRIDTFVGSVNRFLEGKSITIDKASSPSRYGFVTLPANQRAGFGVLSSGERQVLTLLFSATHMSSVNSMVLIDEPELSLHVDWQRIILGELMKQVGDRQVIACTHSPEVAADHQDALIRIQAKPWTSSELTVLDSEAIEQ